MVAKVQARGGRRRSDGSEPFLNVTNFKGINLSESGITEDEPGAFRDSINNIDIYDGYFTERRGTTTITSANTLCPDNVASYV